MKSALCIQQAAVWPIIQDGDDKTRAATDRPSQVIGAHFFNPVPVMPLLEIVRGLQTGDATFEALRVFGERLGKKIVVALKDNPGFIVNLLFIPYGIVGTLRTRQLDFRKGWRDLIGRLRKAAE